MNIAKSVPVVLDRPSRRSAAALLSGILLSLALPPLPLGFLAWFGLVPLFAALEKADNRKEAFKLALLTALLFHLTGMYWIAFNTGAGWGARLGSSIGAIVILTFWVGGVGVLHKILLERWGQHGHLVAVLLWTAQEVLRARGELGFPWVFLSLTQSYYLPVMQLTAVGGTALVSAWTTLLNALLLQRFDRRIKVAVLVTLLALTYAGGYMRIALVRKTMEGPSPGRIGLAQGNIDAAVKWKKGAKYSIDIYETISRELVQQDVDLIVWPETATPVRLQQSRIWRPYMQALVDSLGVPVVTGASHHEWEDGERVRYNAAFMVRPDGHEQFDFYAKVHLVPFGERVPFQ
ncbi:apolipoprotein N-acyltransferase, partial [bacterium]|nr:apolipoprotein N-acyltransferase [bacterium]